MFTIGGEQVAFRWCPATGDGGFMMGSPASEKEKGRGDDEKQHRVVLTRGFWVAETEVTQGLWQAVMGNNPSRFKRGADYPVEQVSWEDCREFLRKVNTSGKLPEGVKAALPTEAQWEYACRAGTSGAYAGDLDRVAWYGGYSGNSGSTTHAVGQKNANGWGLYDMHGNVWEWCADKYSYDYDTTATARRDPTGAKAGQNRVLRGGSWINIAGNCRSAYRYRNWPVNRYGYNGFRLSLQLDTPVDTG